VPVASVTTPTAEIAVRSGGAAGTAVPNVRTRSPVRGWVRFLHLLGLFTLIAIPFTTQHYVAAAVRGAQVSWWWVFRSQLPAWYGWALLTPLIAFLARRYRFDTGHPLRALAVHLSASILLAPVQSFIAHLLRALFHPERLDLLVLDWIPASVLSGSFGGPVIYFVIVGLWYGRHFHRRWRDRTLEASRLEAELARAELEALRLQLHPHFLFNSLNAVTTLLHRDPIAAERVLVQLASLLRAALDSARRQEQPLGEELDLARRYLEVEAVRLGGQLRLEVHAEEATLGLLVPTLILQPLVENAVRHGIAPRGGAGTVRIEARRRPDGLHLAVADDGVGLDVDRGGSGIGLDNTRRRLVHGYGDDHRLEVRPEPGGGARVEVRIPARPSAGEPPATATAARRTKRGVRAR